MENYEKRYKDALEAIKKLQEANPSDEGIQNWVNDNFPELAESKDEKIRKELIEHIKANKWADYVLFQKFSPDDVIAWLEKKGSIEEIVERCKNSWYNEGKIAGMAEGLSDDEKYQQGWHDALEAWKDMRLEVYAQASGNKHEPNDSDDTTKMFSLNDIDEIFEKIAETCEEKPADKVEPKFKVGEWVVDNEEGDFLKVIKVRDNTYRLVSQEGEEFDIQQSVVEYDYHRFTINDAKDADVLYSLDSKQPFIFKHRKPNEQAKVYCGINIYGKFFVWNTKDCIITLDKYIPATKSQRDTLMKAMADAGYEWDAEKKELKKIRQKPTIDYIDSLIDRHPKDNWELVHEFVKKFGRIPEDEDELNVLVEYVLKRQKPTEWSDEDEEKFRDVIRLIEQGAPVQSIREHYTNWFKSLKERIGG